MIFTMLGTSPSAAAILTLVAALALIFMAGQLYRRAKADPACKHRYSIWLAVAPAFISLLLAIMAQTGRLIVSDIVNYWGQFLGMYLVVLFVQATWNSLRVDDSWWARLFFSPFPLMAAPLTLAAMMNSHAIAESIGKAQPLWADHTYVYAILTGHYMSGFFLVLFLPVVATAWVATKVWKRIKNRTAKPAASSTP